MAANKFTWHPTKTVGAIEILIAPMFIFQFASAKSLKKLTSWRCMQFKLLRSSHADNTSPVNGLLYIRQHDHEADAVHIGNVQALLSARIT
jgi:hypothetical protein